MMELEYNAADDDEVKSTWKDGCVHRKPRQGVDDVQVVGQLNVHSQLSEVRNTSGSLEADMRIRMESVTQGPA